eukprot:1160699-Pelagomonas_calceolata.AAC.4
MLAWMYARSRTRAHTRERKHTHTHTNTHIYTNTHVHGPCQSSVLLAKPPPCPPKLAVELFVAAAAAAAAVSVATNFDAPIKLLFPRVVDELGKRPYAMLGLGDIVSGLPAFVLFRHPF